MRASIGFSPLRIISALGLLALVAAADAEAQYFGRNKVEYVDFDFLILRTEHFDVYHYQREERAARLAAQLAERWYARFARLLRHDFDRRQPLVLYSSQPEFAQTNVVSGLLSDTVGGVTESARRRIAMPFAPTLAETDRVLGHEIAHAFQFDIARRHSGGWSQPQWFVEGMAEYLARGAVDTEAILWLRDAAISGRLPPREREAARRLSPYQYGHAFWAYLAELFGDEVVEKALKPVKRSKLNDRFRYATGTDLDRLYSDWREAVHSRYGQKSDEIDAAGIAPFFRDGGSGRVQLGPALSPDGLQAVFFSERDRLSLDLFLADVTTARIVRKLATTTAGARFDSLQPLRSAGAWSPGGEWFAFPAVRQGHAALVLLDMQHPGRDHEIPFADLGQILSATWSPDGQQLVFSALAGGFTDLYLYSLGSRTLQQLTDDAFADLHPAWSPDGREIAFATDRYSSDLTALDFGRPQLALLDLESGAIRAICTAAGSAARNPQWSVDGRRLYFVADPDGIGNVFSFDLRAGVTYRVTDIRTAVTGLTTTSPSLSVASRAPVLAFTIYRGGTHELTILEGLGAMSGQMSVDVTSATADERPGTHQGLLDELLHDKSTGLPDPDAIEVDAYTPRLTLERIGQPYVSSGGGAFGTFVRGGGSLLFGDMLGERSLATAVQIGNRMWDVAFEARFLNREHRWNWGAIAELEPALRRYRLTQTIEHDGQPALMKQADYFQRVQLRLAGLLAYPFNRGLRVEFTGGVRSAAYYRDVRSQVSSLADGRILQQERVTASGGAPTTAIELGTALVGDTAVVGPTAPLLGSRYRFEIAPAAGDLIYTRVLADYRQYLMPARPYTVAMRLLHSGYYGPDGHDARLLPSFLGSRYYVRGHTWDARSCRPEPEAVCGGELLGNRLVVVNLELRVPVSGIRSRQLQYGLVPVDAFLFADGGVVWSSRPAHVLDPGRRSMISSLGMGVRLNAGGLPFELAAVRALDGPRQGWSLDLGFRTGF